MPQELKEPIANQQQDSNTSPAADVAIDKSSVDDSLTPEVQDVEVDLLDEEPAQKSDDVQPTLDSLSDVEKDKWALDDDDRMTDEEMNKELFGDEDSKSEKDLDSSELSDESDQSDESDSDTDDKSDTDRERDADRKKLATRQTTEQYLKSINSLTIDTYTPPSTSREGIDVPAKTLPSMMGAEYRNYPVTAIRYQTPDIYHNPLYFEDRAAERGGVDHGLRQPVVSARKFVVDVFTLPRKKRKARPRSCEYHQNLRYSQPDLIRR